MAQTRFQQIYANENPKREFLYDDGEFFAMLDAFPVNPGHALIIPVEPIVSLFDLSEAQMI